MDRHKHTPNMTPKSCKREVINTGIIKVKSVRRRTRQLRKPVSSRYRMIKDIVTMTTMAAIAIPPIMRACPWM